MSNYTDRLTNGFARLRGDFERALGGGPSRRTASRLDDDGVDLGTGSFGGEMRSRIDMDIELLYNPAFDATLREIEREVEQMRVAGKLMPFREGQHVGMLPPKVKVKKLTKAQFAKLHNERMEREREAMLMHRAKNDAEIALLLQRCF